MVSYLRSTLFDSLSPLLFYLVGPSNSGKYFNFSVLLFPVILTSEAQSSLKKCRVLNPLKMIVKHFATSTDLDFFTFIDNHIL
jgi:hypothetical protein